MAKGMIIGGAAGLAIGFMVAQPALTVPGILIGLWASTRSRR